MSALHVFTHRTARIAVAIPVPHVEPSHSKYKTSHHFAVFWTDSAAIVGFATRWWPGLKWLYMSAIARDARGHVARRTASSQLPAEKKR